MPSDQRCTKTAPCDNCVVLGLKTTDVGLRHVFDSICKHAVLDFKSDQNSLSDDVLLLRDEAVEKYGHRYLQPGVTFRNERLAPGDARFDAKHEVVSEFVEDCSKEQHTKMVDLEELYEPHLYGKVTVAAASFDPLDHLQVPFLVRFESER
jgi:hypothetical protein